MLSVTGHHREPTQVKGVTVSSSDNSTPFTSKIQEVIMYHNEFEAYKAVKKNPFLLPDVKNQTYAVCKLAVRELPLCFIYIKDKDMKKRVLLDLFDLDLDRDIPQAQAFKLVRPQMRGRK